MSMTKPIWTADHPHALMNSRCDRSLFGPNTLKICATFLLLLMIMCVHGRAIQQRIAVRQMRSLGGSFWGTSRSIQLPFNRKIVFHRQMQLAGLNFQQSHIRDEDVIPIVRSFRYVNKLRFDHSAITDKTLQQLPHHLYTNFSLASTEVTDEGMLAVAKCDKLTFLDLSGTRISDQGLKNLGLMSNLRRLRICWTKISEEGFLDFVREHPQCRVQVHEGQFSLRIIEEARMISKTTIILETT